MKDEIKLVQLPIITHKLKEVGKEITTSIEELNIDNLVATVQTLQSMKVLRIDLNKKLSEFETSRKDIKNKISAPYQEFEAIYKIEISEKIKDAVSKLKDKILFVENEIKAQKKQAIEVYFKELCESEEIDFLKLENVGLKIDLSTSLTKLKEKCNEYVVKVSEDLLLIASQEYQIEIIVEYKNTLNVSKAITSVVDRKKKGKQAAIKAKQKEWENRVSQFRNIAMIYFPMTKTFEFNEKIFVKESEVKELANDEFQALIIDLRHNIDEFLKSDEVKEESKPINIPEQKPVAKPLKKPVPEPKIELIETSFKVEATLPKLKGLIKYMEDNNIHFIDL